MYSLMESWLRRSRLGARF